MKRLAFVLYTLAVFGLGFSLTGGFPYHNAEAGEKLETNCIRQPTQMKTHDQKLEHNRFAVRYTVPQCILDSGFVVFNTRFDNGHSFIVTYKKQ